MLKHVWREIVCLLLAYSIGAAGLMTVVFWFMFSGGRITLVEAFWSTSWLLPFAVTVFTLTRVLPSLVALRILRMEFSFDPLSEGDSRWKIANNVLRSEYLRLLKSRRQESNRKAR